MAQFADLLIAQGDFATGAVHYSDQYPGDSSARIVVEVTIEDHFPVQAIVDTGGPWCILDPEIAEVVSPDSGLDFQLPQPLKIRGMDYHGMLRRMRITLAADVGDGLEAEAPVFIPILTEGQIWPFPNFLGLSGFLDCIRFAIDPFDNAFYFGLA